MKVFTDNHISGNPNQTVTFSANPFNWLEASFFYTNVEDRPYCYEDFTSGSACKILKIKALILK